MSDRITKATARRDFCAKLAVEDEYYLDLFIWAENDLAVAMAGNDKVAAARAIAQQRGA